MPASLASHRRSLTAAALALALQAIICLVTVCLYRAYCGDASHTWSVASSHGYIPCALLLLVVISPLSLLAANMFVPGLTSVACVTNALATVLLAAAAIGHLATADSPGTAATRLWGELLPTEQQLTYGNSFEAVVSRVRADAAAVGVSALFTCFNTGYLALLHAGSWRMALALRREELHDKPRDTEPLVGSVGDAATKAALRALAARGVTGWWWRPQPAFAAKSLPAPEDKPSRGQLLLELLLWPILRPDERARLAAGLAAARLGPLALLVPTCCLRPGAPASRGCLRCSASSIPCVSRLTRIPALQTPALCRSAGPRGALRSPCVAAASCLLQGLDSLRFRTGWGVGRMGGMGGQAGQQPPVPSLPAPQAVGAAAAAAAPPAQPADASAAAAGGWAPPQTPGFAPGGAPAGASIPVAGAAAPAAGSLALSQGP